MIRLTVSNGRPIYGMALDASLRPIRDVPDLPWLRLVAVALLAGVAVVLWRQLRRAGWSDAESAAVALGIALLPGAQITVGWAIAWPIALALLFTMLGFSVVESHLQRTGAIRIAALAGGGFLYFMAALTYQTGAMFAVVPLAALLLVRGEHERLGHGRWVAAHLATLFVSLVAAFVLMQLFFTEGVVAEASRMQLEPDPLLKLLWFVRQPLVNSLALFELRDRFDTSPWFWVVAASFGTILALGFLLRRARRFPQGALAVLLAVPAVHRARRQPCRELAGGWLSDRVPAVGARAGAGRVRPAQRGGRGPNPAAPPAGGVRRVARVRGGFGRAQCVHADRRAAEPRMGAGPNRGGDTCGSTPIPTSTSFGPVSTIARPSKSSTTSSGRCLRTRTGPRGKCSRPRCARGSPIGSRPGPRTRS